MAHIIFYTKKGCKGGIKQKSLLVESGHTVEERSLLDTKWTPEILKSYLGKLSVEEWYNKNAPQVKAGVVVPGNLSAEDTLELLCQNPILIKRPLMEINGELIAGFDVNYINELIGLKNIPIEDLTSCQHSKNEPCTFSL